jgi:chemotaxis-related protein WspB
MLFVQFSLDADRYLLDTAQIERMLPRAPLKALPSAPRWVAGIMDYESEPVPVVDLSALALGRDTRERLSTRLALVHYPHQTAHGVETRRLGLLLEGATRTVKLDAAAFRDAGVDTPHARYLGPLAHDEHLLPDDVQALLFAERAA